MRRLELNYIDLKVTKRNPQCQDIADITNSIMEAWRWFPQERFRHLVREKVGGKVVVTLATE